jgi:hypothetical protein
MMTSRNPTGENRDRRPILALAGAMIFPALAFWFFTTFTQQLFSTKGSLAGLKHLSGLSHIIAQHPTSGTAIVICLVLALICWIIAARNVNREDWILFFQGRTGTAILLLSVALCQLPIYLTPGVLDRTDPLCHVNAMEEAAANYRLGQWPVYTFHYANGATLGLQYPPLRTFLGGLVALVSPAGGDFDYELLSAATHLFLLIGFYRFLRLWNFSRPACALPALTLAGCHQMLVYFLSGSLPTQMSSAFALWCFVSLVRWFRSGKWRHGAACGYWLGFALLAHPVTALFTGYFLALFGGGLLLPASPGERKKIASQIWIPPLFGVLVALPYLVSLVAFRAYDTYRPENVAVFQDKNLHLIANFKWIFKYFHAQPVSAPTGEYVSVIVFILAAIGLIKLFRTPSSSRSSLFSGYALSCLIFFGIGAIIFYGRDTAPVMAIPGVKLLKVYNRSFIFFSLGLGLLAARTLDDLFRGRRHLWLLAIGLLLLLEQAPYWIRPAYFFLPDNLRFHAADFSGADRKTSSFMVIFPLSAGGDGNREDVFFHRAGFSGVSPIEHEEQPMPGRESEIFHNTISDLKDTTGAQPIMDRLKWLRVTDVVWRRDSLPVIDLSSFGQVRTIANGLDLHLNGPIMERALRTVKLQTVPADLQPDGTTLLPIGFSPFLHCTLNDQSGAQIPLLNRGGYASISLPLAAGTGLLITAVTPWYQSLAIWISLCFILVAGFYLITAHSRRKSAA